MKEVKAPLESQLPEKAAGIDSEVRAGISDAGVAMNENSTHGYSQEQINLMLKIDPSLSDTLKAQNSPEELEHALKNNLSKKMRKDSNLLKNYFAKTETGSTSIGDKTYEVVRDVEKAYAPERVFGPGRHDEDIRELRLRSKEVNFTFNPNNIVKINDGRQYAKVLGRLIYDTDKTSLEEMIEYAGIMNMMVHDLKLTD